MSEMNLREKLLLVQRALKAPKGQYNSFGKYHYRSCEDILEALKPLLADAGLALTLTDKIVMVGERYYVEARAIVGDENGSIEVTAYAREEKDKKGMDGAQITGSASSYARKYALNGLFLIDDSRDPDMTNTGDEQDKKASKPKEKTKPDHLEPIRAILGLYKDKLGITSAKAVENITDHMGVSNMQEVGPDDVEEVLRFMSEQMEEAG